MKRSDIDYYPLPVGEREQCCYWCKHCYESEAYDGTWWLYCFKKFNNKDGSQVFSWDKCELFEWY